MKRKTESRDVYGNPSRGYWLVRDSDQSRHFIGPNVSEPTLQRVCNRVLTDDDYGYWIDYCYGPDVNGAPAWSNLDHTDRFF